MGREGYSPEAYEAAAAEMAEADKDLAGKKEAIATENQKPIETGGTAKERFVGDLKDAGRDMKTAAEMVGSWGRVRLAEHKLVSLHEQAQGEAMELESEHERLKQAAVDAAEKLSAFETEKLGIE